jgi:L-aminopeptidase/D-esterase-like protein
MNFEPGRRNLITDVNGLQVGNASDENIKTGVTALLFDRPAVASVKVLGGAPGTRETDLLEPHNTVDAVHALVLSGGSAFGLDAASGVQAFLHEKGIGYPVGDKIVPIVPAAILFDLTNGGNKEWGRFSPYRELGYEAASRATTEFEIGTAGAGTGALTATVKGGLGSASAKLGSGITLGAIVAANPRGSPIIGKTRHFWAAPFEKGNEFGGLGLPSPMPNDVDEIVIKFRESSSPAANTTIAIVATDAVLTKAQARTLAIAAHDGFVRAIWPTHLPTDGDLVFAVATGAANRTPDIWEFEDLCARAGAVMARAIARGIYAAKSAENDLKPAWSRWPEK